MTWRFPYLRWGVKSFDTVDRDILGCASGRLGLTAWFRWVYFAFHREVRLRFKLATGLGVSWTRDDGIPHGYSLSLVFIVALCVPWCRSLGVLKGLLLSCMLTNSSAALTTRIYNLPLLNVLLLMSRLCFSAPLRLLETV